MSISSCMLPAVRKQAAWHATFLSGVTRQGSPFLRSVHHASLMSELYSAVQLDRSSPCNTCAELCRHAQRSRPPATRMQYSRHSELVSNFVKTLHGLPVHAPHEPLAVQMQMLHSSHKPHLTMHAHSRICSTITQHCQTNISSLPARLPGGPSRSCSGPCTRSVCL